MIVMSASRRFKQGKKGPSPIRELKLKKLIDSPSLTGAKPVLGCLWCPGARLGGKMTPAISDTTVTCVSGQRAGSPHSCWEPGSSAANCTADNLVIRAGNEPSRSFHIYRESLN